MRKHFRYILVSLIFVIVYLLYLIFGFKYIDIQKDYSIIEIEKEITQRKEDLKDKKNYFNYINTLAYKDKIAKMSQNKKNPWEEVVFITSKEEVEQYKKIDTEWQMFKENEVKSKTFWMENRQKWIYIILKKDVREENAF